jgi:protein phosphatase
MARKDSKKTSPTVARRQVAQAPPVTSRFGVGALSDVGRVRELNEDNWRWEPLSEDLALYAVADGMGGHDRGEVASRIAIDTLFQSAQRRVGQLNGRDAPAMRDLLREAMQEANRAVVAEGERNDSNMGTTLCAALVYDERRGVVGNVGDSRVYLMRGEALSQVSQDHSLVAYLVQLGELTAAEARNHPSGNILVRSIGSQAEVEVDIFQLDIVGGDRLLLCSDGLWGEASDEEISGVLRNQPSPQDACRALVEIANSHGGRDNTTLIVVNL